jgi:DNA-binding CsgD family transcriptional regulator
MRLIDAAISDPAVSGIAIYGSAGVGKTRIAREALDGAASKGWEARWVVGTSCARGLPLGALASWTELAGSDSLQLVCDVIHALTAADPATPVVVGVDDAHLLDELSMFVLQQIVQRRAAKVLLSIRSDELIPLGIRELWKLNPFDRLDLEPLSSDEVTTLLSAALNGSVDPQAAGGLWQLTRGNTLYLQHIVEQEIVDGRLTQQNGHWQWTGHPVVPHSLVELIECHIGTLPSPVGAVVDALAVGEPIELAALQRITDADAVEEADTRGLIRLDYLDSGIEVRVAHPLYSEVRRNRAAPTRLRRLRGLVAAELAAADNRDDMQVTVRRAALSLDSDLTPDAGLLVRAARGAICLADLPLAGRLAKAAEHAGGGPEAQFIRAHALSWLGRGPEAEEVLAEVAVSELTDEEYARFTYLRASNLLWALAEPGRAQEVIDEGDAHITAAPARMSIDAIRTVYWFATDRPDLALLASKDLVIDDLPPIVGAETTWALAAVYADAGRTSEAVAMAETGYAIATRCSDAPHMTFNIADAHVGALVLVGRISDALEVAERARRRAADLPGAAGMLGPAVAGRSALGAGRLDTACSLLDQASRALSATGHAMGWGFRYSIPRATALAMRGLVDEAEAALEALNAVRRPFRLLAYERSLARAWVAAGQGAVSEAIDIVRSAAEIAGAIGRFAAEVVCLQTATQFGDRSCEPRLRELEAIVEGPRVGLAAQFAAAMRDEDTADLEEVSAGFEALGDDLAALDAAAQAAVSYRRQDLRGSALGCAARAAALAERCEADTPALEKARVPMPLTDREREIVMLVGQGLSNRDIADRLTLSVRTVEGHVYKAMTKTGTVSREELAALISNRPPT